MRFGCSKIGGFSSTAAGTIAAGFGIAYNRDACSEPPIIFSRLFQEPERGRFSRPVLHMK